MSQDDIYYEETPESRKHRLEPITRREIEKQEEIKKRNENGLLAPATIEVGENLNHHQLRNEIKQK